MVDLGHRFSETTVDLADVRPFILKKKGRVVMIQGAESSIGQLFEVVGLPRYFSADRPYEIRNLRDTKATRRTMDSKQFTRIEDW